MKPNIITKITYKGLEELPEEARHCKFSGEVTAQDSIFKTYSQESCEFECQIKKSREICQCTPWNIPTATHPMENPVICDLYGNYCFNIQMRNADLIVNCIEQCPSSCNDVQFTITEKEIPINVREHCDNTAVDDGYLLTQVLSSWS